MSKFIKKIVIVGGGSAGWMTASTLIARLKNKDITVIESPNIPTVGVGESTIGGIRDWLQLLDIKDEDFMQDTDASYKLAIKFEDFYRKNSEPWYYPFGFVNTEGNINRKNDWYYKKIVYPETPLSDYYCSIYPHMSMVTKNKISKNEKGELPNYSFNRSSAFHFDATKFAIWLKNNYCLPKGVNHIIGTVNYIQKNEDGIEFLQLDNGDKITADLFIDCTGFKSLLLGETLNEPFISYSDLLPNNTAWATKIEYTDKENQLQPFTNCTAIENGWVWNIPLWSRIGTGYVFSNEFISDDEALVEFKNYLEKKGHKTNNLKFNKINMRVGIHRRLWVDNVCAIGLSAGFIEPLESSGLMTVHTFLLDLLRELSVDGYISQTNKDNFSYVASKRFKFWAEFVAMHYAYSHRDDTNYWKKIGKKSFYKQTVDSIDLPQMGELRDFVRQREKYFEYTSEFDGLHCLLTGMNVFPLSFDTIKSFSDNGFEDDFDIKERLKPYADALTNKTNYWESIIDDSPNLYQFLKQNIYKEDK